MTTTIDLAPPQSQLEEITSHVAAIQRPDNPVREYNERRAYLNSELDGGHVSPEVAMEALLAVPNEFQDGMIQQTYEELMDHHGLNESRMAPEDIESAKWVGLGKYMQNVVGQFELRLVPDTGSSTPAVQNDALMPTVIDNAPEAQDGREPKTSLKERIGNLRPIKALKAAKTAYAIKARAQRELNSIDPNSPTYDADAHEAAKTFAAEKSDEYRIARKRAIGGTALAGAVVGTFVAMSDKLSIPFGSNESMQEGKNILALSAAGALMGAGSLWREKRKISEDQRKDLLEWKYAEIDNYEEARGDDHDFSNDEYYQDLWDEAESLTPAGLKDRISTKWAEWGIYGGAVGVNNLDRFLQWAKNKATKAEPMLSWDQIESDIMSELPEEDRNVIQMNMEIVENYRFDPASVDEDAYQAAQRKLNAAQKVISDRYAHEYASSEGRRWGKAALIVGGLALTALAVKYAPDIDMPDMPWSGNKSGNKGGSTIAENLPTGSSGTGSGSDTKAKIAEQIGMPSGVPKKTQDIIVKASEQISQTHKTDIGSTEFNKIAENTFKLAAKREEFIGNGGSGRQFDANFQAYMEHMKDLEEAAQAAN